MKKLLVGLVLGWTIHMLYLDGILIHQHIVLGKCDVNEKRLEDGTLPCLKYANELPYKYKLKYFNVYTLFNYDHVVIPEWNME